MSCAVQALAAAVLLAGRALGREAVTNDSDEVRAFGRAPALAFAALSTEGDYFSYAQQSGARQALVIRRLADGTEARPLIIEPAGERLRWCGWADSRYLLCGTVLPVRAQARISERTKLYAIDAIRDSVKELNSRLADPVHDQVIDLLPARPARVLLQYAPAGHGFPAVAELDIPSGRLHTLVEPLPPVTRWMSDARAQVRLGVGYQDGMASIMLRRVDGQSWSLYREQLLADPEAIGPVAFGAAPDELYVLKLHRGRTALFRADLHGGAPTLLFADPAYDVAGPLLKDPLTGQLLAVRYVGERETAHFFDAAEAARQAAVDRLLPRTVNTLVSRTLDGRRILVRSASDVDPPSWFLFDSRSGRMTGLGHDYPQLETRQLAAVHPASYRARDGQRIPAYLTLPPGQHAGGLPAVVLPHGGPEARDWQTFDPLAQFLAAQGYAVLQMNFRGSLGYGAGFAAAGAGQWGGVIHNDITDGARWLVEQGLADPARICIVGRSFGGYAALMGAARESEWYACAASYAGPADLMALAQHAERLDSAQIWRERLGSDPRALWQMSPMARTRTVRTPVLLMHGRKDAVVPVSQSRRFARALQREGKPHTLIERSDCDHDMTVESCRLVFFSRLRGFIAGAMQRN